METIKKTLEMPSDTFQALERLGKITGAEGGVPEVIQDALRVYEWAIYEQSQGHDIFAWPPLTPEQTKAIQNVPNLEIQKLEPLFDQKAKEEVQRLFKAA
jgi:hypothetical protein